MRESKKADFIKELQSSPIALSTRQANEQHYEVPPAFFQEIMGPHLKYSCGWFDENTTSLDTAEENMLKLYIERLDIQNHQRVLDLGCGWGSFHTLCCCKIPKFKFCSEYLIPMIKLNSLTTLPNQDLWGMFKQSNRI